MAELAGIPAPCLDRAREILRGLENEARSAPPSAKPEGPSQAQPNLPLFEEHPVLHELRLLNHNDLTPMEALKRLAEWKKRL